MTQIATLQLFQIKERGKKNTEKEGQRTLNILPRPPELSTFHFQTRVNHPRFPYRTVHGGVLNQKILIIFRTILNAT